MATESKRRYRMRARATAAAATERRIVEAALALFVEQWLDQITLEAVAARADVTIQTVLRRFGSKEGLIAAAGAVAYEQTMQQRNEAPIGDIAGAIANLLTHYEAVGDRVMRLLAQEERWPVLRPIAEAGRVAHRAWVERTFAPFLASRQEASRGRRLAQLVAVMDVYVWKLLRRDLGLGSEEAEAAIRDLVTAVAEGDR